MERLIFRFTNSSHDLIYRRFYQLGYRRAFKRSAREFRRKLEPQAITATEEQIELMKDCSRILRGGLKALNLRPEPLLLNRVYILKNADFGRFDFPAGDPIGAYAHESDCIVLSERGVEEADFKWLFLHELVHAYARTVVVVDAGRKKKFVRTGHAYIHNTTGKATGFGLNEAVTERIARELTGDIPPTIFSFRDSNGKLPDGLHSYDYFIETLGVVIRGMATRTETPPEKVWRNYKLGHFTGTTHHLEELNSVFGDGSRDVLETMGALFSSPERGDDLMLSGQIARYFRSGIDEEERLDLKREILRHSPALAT